MLLINSFVMRDTILSAPSTEITYGEQIDLTDFNITNVSIFGCKSNKTVYSDMVEYDSEQIGLQTAKFSYKDTEITFDLTILPAQLDTPTISYSLGIAAWNNINNASEYLVSINNTEHECLSNTYDLGEYSGTGELSLKVKAIASDEHYSDSNYSNPISVNKLSSVTGITYNDGYILWDAVANATKYNIWINDTKYESNTNSYAFVNFNEGSNSIIVKAVGDSYSTAPGAEYEGIITKLNSVTNIRCSSSQILWDSSNTGCTYLITINGVEYTTSATSYDMSLLPNTTYTVSVTAIASTDVTVDSNSIESSVIYKKLTDPIVAITLGNYSDSYIINITAVENATNYSVVVIQYKSDSSVTYTYNISNLSKEISVGTGVIKIEVRVYAYDSTGVYDDSDITTIERDV